MIYKPNSIQDFITILRENEKKYILLVFYMDGCHVCSEMEEYLFNSNFNIPIIKLDITIFNDIANDNNIDKVPTSIFIICEKDTIIWNSEQYVGLDKNAIESIIKKIISTSN